MTDYLTPTEVAGRLRYSPAYVRELCLSGKLRAFRPVTNQRRGFWRIPADAVEEYLSQYHPEEHPRNKE